MRFCLSFAALLLFGCASARPKSTDGEALAIDRWETRAQHTFTAEDDCSQGPLIAHLPALESTYARRVLLTFYSPRVLPIHATFHFSRTEFTVHWATDESGRAKANAAQARCRVPAEAAPPPPGTGPSNQAQNFVHHARAGSAPAARGQAPAPAAPPAPVIRAATPVEVPTRELPSLPSSLQADPHQYALEFWNGDLTPVRSVDVTTTSWAGGIKGGIDLQLWGDDMLDLRDVVFQIEEQELVPVLSVAEYERALQAQLDVRRAQKEQCTRTAGPGCPKEEPSPPELAAVPANRPPPPPRVEVRSSPPSPAAVWISGAWRWSGSDYEWVPGLWRVPTPPLQRPASPPVAVRTAPPPPPLDVDEAAPPPPATVVPKPPPPSLPKVEVPPVPPPLRFEVIPAATTAGAVWTPGYWSWNGAAYIWVSGRWQVPPNARARWQSPEITVNGAGVTVQLPGGWIEIGH